MKFDVIIPSLLVSPDWFTDGVRAACSRTVALGRSVRLTRLLATLALPC
jgi:hypothetical protein